MKVDENQFPVNVAVAVIYQVSQTAIPNKTHESMKK
jgi:hypothetical protein